jgi:hypothetical protein
MQIIFTFHIIISKVKYISMKFMWKNFQDILKKKEKKLINLKYYFNEDMISSYYSVKGHHLSPYGYKIVSDIIKEKLKK